MGSQLRALLVQIGQIFLDLVQLLTFPFPLDRLFLDFQLFDLTVQFINLLWHGIHLQTQTGSRLIYQVDSFIRQETIGNIPVRQLHGCDDGIIRDTHFMVILVTLLQSPHNTNRTHHVRFVNHHFLETPLQSFILFKIFLVLVQRGCTDSSQITTSQSGFQYIRCIHCPVGLSGPHQGMNLIDKQYNFTFRSQYLVNNRFQTFLEFSFIFCPRNQSSHIQRVNTFGCQI